MSQSLDMTFAVEWETIDRNSQFLVSVDVEDQLYRIRGPFPVGHEITFIEFDWL